MSHTIARAVAVACVPVMALMAAMWSPIEEVTVVSLVTVVSWLAVTVFAWRLP